MDYFIELFGRLPRAGPGDDASTRRAFGALKHLPRAGRILDLGCGPGRQTVELLRLFGGMVVAVDLLPEMIARARQSTVAAGLAERVRVVQADMQRLPFAPDSFDVVWCEGAIYFLGFEKGLAELKPLVKTGGCVAVSEAVWLRPDPPAELAQFWQAYPEIDTVPNKLQVIEGQGYQIVDHFVLPKSSWIDDYYAPLLQRIAEVQPGWKGIPEAEAVLTEARQELVMFEQYSDWYGYAFFIIKHER